MARVLHTKRPDQDFGFFTKERNPNIMKYIPKSKRDWVDACWHDSDGYWIMLKEGYNAGRMERGGCHTIHEDTIAELRYQIGGIEVDPYTLEEE